MFVIKYRKLGQDAWNENGEMNDHFKNEFNNVKPQIIKLLREFGKNLEEYKNQKNFSFNC